MNAIRAIQANFERLGYHQDALIADFSYPDVMLKNPVTRTVALAAFTKAPVSYRTAAFGVVPVEPGHEAEAAKQHRALGAPLLMCYSSDRVSVWQVSSADEPRKLDDAALDQVDQLFDHYTKDWNPERIHRAKSIGMMERVYQLDFVDLGLLPAIEGQIHLKLDRILQDVLEALSRRKPSRGAALNERQQYHFTFRLLAAKILQDRGHAFANKWDSGNVQSVLTGILDYYNLKKLRETSDIKNFHAVAEAWEILRNAISFRNLSADDLAFVYENTLVTGEARDKFGIHSTPRSVADYVVSNIRFSEFDTEKLCLYEPFSGAAPFLISALRHVRDLLPKDWDAKRCHEYLIKHVWAHEFDEFACDVAMLSLILADYPNQNGWHVDPADLFKGDVLQTNLARASIALCNPPWEDFNDEERAQYPEYAAKSVHKPIAVLEVALDQPLQALGFVLPYGLLKHAGYASVRARIEKSFSDIKLVSLPDRIFQHSVVPSALLIAQGRRSEEHASRTTHLVSSDVTTAGREDFLALGEVNDERVVVRPYKEEAAGNIWVEPLAPVWESLAGNAKLSTYADISRGLEWKYNQTQARSTHKKEGFKRGIARIKGSLRQFSVDSAEYLDVRMEKQRGNAYLRPWKKRKILASAARISRGPWRFAASIDDKGLYASQQIIGIWVKDKSPYSLEEVTAILNSPIGNAYLYAHEPDKRFTLTAVGDIPMPGRSLGAEFLALYTEYVSLLNDPDPIRAVDRDTKLPALLAQIDAEVLAAYDLPPILERELLEFFRGATRPVDHEFAEWIPSDFSPAMALKDYLEADLKKVRGPWIMDVFTPLPEDEADALREALG